MADPTAAERQLIGDIWTSSATYDNLEYLCDTIGNRWAGSPSEHAAGEWLRDTLVAYGVQNVHLEPVQFGAWERGEAVLRMTAPVERNFSCVALPYCPAGEIEAELIDVGDGEEDDFARLGDAVRGKIAVCAAETNPAGRPSGKLSHRTDKLARAVAAGAAAFIFVNQNPGLLHITGGVGAPGGKPAAIIAVGVSWETGSAILRLAKRGRVPTGAPSGSGGPAGGARLSLRTGGRFFENTSYNVVGDIPGSRRADELVITGGHYDGHDISQGALDDGAGTVVCLEALVRWRLCRRARSGAPSAVSSSAARRSASSAPGPTPPRTPTNRTARASCSTSIRQGGARAARSRCN